MKAIYFSKYGGPEVLQSINIEKPQPKPDEVLIKIKSTTVSSADALMLASSSFMSRMILGLNKPRKKYRILGLELAGEIEAIGDKVTRFKTSDKVFAFAGFQPGTYAEYLCMKQNKSLEHKPTTCSFNEAVSFVDGASTALFFLKDKAQVKKGQKVLIIGASGAIGSYAVQLAKLFGAEVTGVCSEKNISLVKNFGTQHVIDYNKEDYLNSSESYDVIFDTAGKSSFTQCKKALTKNGKYLVTTGPMLKLYMLSFWTKMFCKKKAIFAMSVDKRAALKYIKQLVEKGQLIPHIDRTYTLDQIPEAHRYLKSGNKQGNIIIQVS